MKGQGNDKLALIVLLVALLALQVTSRSFRIAGERSPRYSPDDDPINSGSSSGSHDDYKHVDSDMWRKNGISNLVNVFENRFSVDEPHETNQETNQNLPDEGITGEDSILSVEEQEMIKKRILDGLGLTTIPTRNLSNIPEEEIAMAYREYAKAVQEEEKKYKAQMEEEEDDKDEHDDDDDDDREGKNKNISSFRFYSNRVTKHIHRRGRRSANDGQQIVHFSVSLLSSSDTNISHVVEATSRFWKRGIYPRSANATSSTISVSFYRLDDIPRGRSRYTKLDPVFLTTKNVSIYNSEWLELDMTDAVRKWMDSPSSDTGILIKCPDCGAAGIKFLTGGHRKGLSGKIPRLDVRTEVLGLRRVKRSRKMRKSMKRKIHRHADCHDATHARGKRSKRCCRRSMQVRFADLPRFDFILSPKEFDAYYCSGKCPARYNPANEHALLQSLLNLRGKNNVPGPCCAPTKLKGLNILHIGKDGRIETTFWRDVIVTECGCA